MSLLECVQSGAARALMCLPKHQLAWHAGVITEALELAFVTNTSRRVRALSEQRGSALIGAEQATEFLVWGLEELVAGNDAPADDIVQEFVCTLQQYYTERSPVFAWEIEVGARAVTLPSEASDLLETSFTNGLQWQQGPDWVADFTAMSLRPTSSTITCPLRRTYRGAQQCQSVPAMSFAAPSSDDGVIWESSGVQLSPLISLVCEFALEGWKQRGEKELSVVLAVGDVTVTLYPSLVGCWEVWWGQDRFLVSRLVEHPDDDMDGASGEVTNKRVDEVAQVYRAASAAHGGPLEEAVRAIVECLCTTGTYVLDAAANAEAVMEAMRLPFVDPRRFVLDEGQDVQLREMHVNGVWLPLTPVNDWMLSRGWDSVFLFGKWHPLGSNAALRVEGSNEFVWLRARGDAPVRFVCRGVPMSLDRRVLSGVNCPAAFLEDDVVVYDELLSPVSVRRTWQGDRTDLLVLEYFGIGKRGMTSTSIRVMRGTNESTSGGVSTKEFSAAAARLAAANKYAYKFPVMCSANGL